jgi:hypothetical protein
VNDEVEDTDLHPKSRNPFWTLRRRGPLVHRPETALTGIEGRRVVSERVLPERRGGMSVLRRFKLGRGHQEMVEDDGDITISTETVSCPTASSVALIDRISLTVSKVNPTRNMIKWAVSDLMVHWTSLADCRHSTHAPVLNANHPRTPSPPSSRSPPLIRSRPHPRPTRLGLLSHRLDIPHDDRIKLDLEILPLEVLRSNQPPHSSPFPNWTRHRSHQS